MCWRAPLLEGRIFLSSYNEAAAMKELVRAQRMNPSAPELLVTLGQAVVVYGDANRVNTDLAKLQAVTAAQIKDVMNRYITGKKKVVVEYLPETMKPGFVAPPSEKTEKKP